jgi:hypothetical protein
MGTFDIKTDGVAFATASATNAASIGADLRPRKNLPERILSVVGDVRPGEGLGALILAINLFTLLGAYYLLKTVRESLIPSASDCRTSLLMLAVMDVCVSSLLLFHKDGSCIPAGRKKFEELNEVRQNWSSGVVRMLAVVTVLGAATSSLLDLVFRVRVADHFSSQAQRIHFMGSLQGFLCLGALLLRFGVRRLTGGPWAKRCLTLYPGILTVAVLASASVPVFHVFEFLRIGEYSLRNSLSRCGIEMVYATLPDKL